ncbi:MAG TPA: hypothetical protein DE061_05725 [Clostridiales bacterium]|nr:hypothetical protein [Clostridiales bacterium]
MDAVIKVILREIQLECQRQIGIERRGGRAIKEEEIEPYPDRFDFDVQSEVPQIETKLSVTAIPGKTLAQLVEDNEATDKAESSPDPQMTVDEAISNVEKSEQPPTQPAQQECDIAPRAPRSKFGAWFEAIRDWHFTRKEKEYKYECAKQRAEDRTYGFEYISDFIDDYIERLEKDESSNSTNGQVF